MLQRYGIPGIAAIAWIRYNYKPYSLIVGNKRDEAPQLTIDN